MVDSGRLDEALDLQKNAPGLTPDGTFQASLAMALLPTVPASKAEMMRARKAHETAIGRLAEVNCTIDENTVMATGSNFLAAYQGLGNAPGQRLIADFYRRNCPALDFQAPHIGAGRETGGLIRVGFVSTNFYNHTIGKLYRGIIAGLDRARFQVITFSTYPPDDEISRFIERHSDRFEILPEQLAPARRILAAAALDILFYPDIGMAPLTYFLAFARLAPMQCAGWGHPVTTGIDSIDYFISSTDLEPPDPDLAARQYSETLFRGCLLPSYLHPPETSTVNVGPDLAFAAGRTIYICPQSLFKIHPDFDDLLARILEGDEQAVFVFIEGQIGWSQILRARWGSLSARLADRVHFVPRQDQNGFRALIETSHVVLDTVHFSGGLSSAEILTLGKPIVTWPSASLACGRVTHAYYRQMGVTECTAKDLDDYVRIALRLGTDAGWRRQVESKIKENSDKLFRREDALEELAGFLENAHAAARDGTKLSADLLGRAFDRDETGLDGTTGADLL